MVVRRTKVPVIPERKTARAGADQGNWPFEQYFFHYGIDSLCWMPTHTVAIQIKKKLLYFLSIITFCALNKQILNLMNIFKAYYSNM